MNRSFLMGAPGSHASSLAMACSSPGVAIRHVVAVLPGRASMRGLGEFCSVAGLLSVGCRADGCRGFPARAPREPRAFPDGTAAKPLFRPVRVPTRVEERLAP